MEALIQGLYHYSGSGWVPGSLWAESSPEPGTIRYRFVADNPDDIPAYPRPQSTKGRHEGLCWGEALHEAGERLGRMSHVPMGHQLFQLRVRAPTARVSARRGVPEFRVFASINAARAVELLAMVRSTE